VKQTLHKYLKIAPKTNIIRPDTSTGQHSRLHAGCLLWT